MLFSDTVPGASAYSTDKESKNVGPKPNDDLKWNSYHFVLRLFCKIPTCMYLFFYLFLFFLFVLYTGS